MLFGIVSLSVFHLKLGIDFKGGTEIELQFNQVPNTATVQSAVATQNLGNFQVQTASNNSVIIETETLTTDQHASLLGGC